MKADDKTLEEMLAEIAPKTWQPGDLTITSALEQNTGIRGRKTMQLMLDRLVETGKAEKFYGQGENGRSCWIWRKVE